MKKSLVIIINLILIALGVTLISLGLFVPYLNGLEYYFAFGALILLISFIFLVIYLIKNRKTGKKITLFIMMIFDIFSFSLVAFNPMTFLLIIDKKENMSIRYKYGSPSLLLEKSNPLNNLVGIDSLPDEENKSYDKDKSLYEKILSIEFKETFKKVSPITKNCTSYITYVTGHDDITALYLKDNGEAIVYIGFDLSPTRMYYFRYDKNLYSDLYILASNIVNR